MTVECVERNHLLLSKQVSTPTLSRQPRLQRQPRGIPAVEELQTLPAGRAHPPPVSHERYPDVALDEGDWHACNSARGQASVVVGNRDGTGAYEV